MRGADSGHIADEVIERYSMGKVPDVEAASLEEHILVCEQCQDRLEEVDRFIVALREARLHRLPEPTSRWQAWKDRLSVGWKLALAPGFAAAALLVMLVSPGPYDRQTVDLSTVRGGDAALVTALAGRPLRVNLDLSGIEPLGRYRVEIVDAGGRRQWSSTTSGQGEKLLVETDLSPHRGQYWVRVYQPEPGETLLREFALRVE